MRKLVFLPIVFSVFCADLCAFGAAARGSRTTVAKTSTNGNTVASTSAPVAARAAVRGAKPVSTIQPAQQNAPVSARAATRNTQKTTADVTTKPVSSGVVTARAGAKQGVINMGTKISSATANTVISQECQDAYFGCMDSFCMLENVTGGRCKCSDKNAEYDDILAEIMKLDQQSYVMQTEGVALLKMGKSAEEVYAMAENAADRVSKGKDSKKDETADKSGSSSGYRDWFAEVEDVWEEDATVLDSDLTSKTGDKLHAIAAQTCSQQIPTQCKASMSMLRMIYVQKIQSDCAAYDNSLRRQQSESNQKLQTARQSLRDTALEKYQEANKYDLGGCVRAFSACMQQGDVCGDGFLGCVTFAAMDNLQNNTSGSAAELTTIEFAKSKITLANTTMDELLSKSVMCDSVLEQCVSVKDKVWDAFLKNAAPAIKTAESDAESKLRMNCINEITQCYLNGCKEQMDPNNPDGSYDMCLSNPGLFKSLCKPKLEPCLLATGGTYESPDGSLLWNGLTMRLNSLKVDACTTQVKECLLSEDRCGKDYAGCIGLSTEDIKKLCPVDKLTACAGTEEIGDYVARVAQGIALGIDNSVQAACESALKTAMLTYCGAETECPNAIVDESIFESMLQPKLCKKGSNGSINEADCSSDPTFFSEADLVSGNISAVLFNQIDISKIQYTLDNIDIQSNQRQTIKKPIFGLATGAKTTSSDVTYSKVETNKLLNVLNNNYNAILAEIESDPKVLACMSGRQVQGVNLTGGDKAARFPMLTQSARRIIAKAIMADVPRLYMEKEAEIRSGELLAMQTKQEKRVKEAFDLIKSQQDGINLQVCQSFTDADGGKDITPEYYPETAICKLKFYDGGDFKGELSYHFPLVTSADWVIQDVAEVREFVHPSGFYALPRSEIKEYRKAYGEN